MGVCVVKFIALHYHTGTKMVYGNRTCVIQQKNSVKCNEETVCLSIDILQIGPIAVYLVVILSCRAATERDLDVDI